MMKIQNIEKATVVNSAGITGEQIEKIQAEQAKDKIGTTLNGSWAQREVDNSSAKKNQDSTLGR